MSDVDVHDDDMFWALHEEPQEDELKTEMDIWYLQEQDWKDWKDTINSILGGF